MPVEITTATAFRQGTKPVPLRTIVIMAHLDTGATRSSIDEGLAQQLQLIPTLSKYQYKLRMCNFE